MFGDCAVRVRRDGIDGPGMLYRPQGEAVAADPAGADTASSTVDVHLMALEQARGLVAAGKVMSAVFS